MIDLQDICTIAQFQKQTRKHMRRLKKTGKPQVLTQNGRAEVVVQSAKAYQELLERADLAESVRIVGKRASDSRRRNVPADKVLAEIRAKLGIQGRR